MRIKRLSSCMTREVPVVAASEGTIRDLWLSKRFVIAEREMVTLDREMRVLCERHGEARGSGQWGNAARRIGVLRWFVYLDLPCTAVRDTRTRTRTTVYEAVQLSYGLEP